MSDIPEVPGQASTGGQTPTNEPRGGQTAYDASGSIRDRLSSPTGPEQAGSRDTRGSNLGADDFVQTDSGGDLQAKGRSDRQLLESKPPIQQELQPGRAADLDESAARSAERKVAALFLSSFVGVVGFVVTFAFAPYRFAVDPFNQLYTPLLGAFMALALFGIGAGAVLWAKTLMVDEEAVQQRHALYSSAEERESTKASLSAGFTDTGIARRPLLRNTLLLGAGSLAVLPVPLLFGFGPYAHKERVLAKTGWKKDVRLIDQDSMPVRPDQLDVGGVLTVFPDVPDGTKLADSASLLIRMRPDELDLPEAHKDWAVNGYLVYSIICTHLGCPVKLYEQQTHHLFCPCHQSTFDASKGAVPLFGPAARPLPQLAISLDADGYFIARGDFAEPVGSSYWERSS